MSTQSVAEIELAARRTGKRAALAARICLEAATPEDAELALKDLDAHGYCFLSDKGWRIAPGLPSSASRPAIKWDEEPA